MWTCAWSYAASEGGLAEKELESSEVSSPEAAAPGSLSVSICRSWDGHRLPPSLQDPWGGPGDFWRPAAEGACLSVGTGWSERWVLVIA